MFDSIIKFFKKFSKEEKDSKDTAKERLHLVLMQDRANVSADFMELMKQEIIEVIKKYIDVDENSIDVKLTNKVNSDGTTGAPMLYANIPILNVKDDTKQINVDRTEKEEKQENTTLQEKQETKKEEVEQPKVELPKEETEGKKEVEEKNKEEQKMENEEKQEEKIEEKEKEEEEKQEK